MTEQSPFSATLFSPADDDTAGLLAWFERYDAHASRNEVEAMADMALFPITVMTSDSQGESVTREWDRATFVQAMSMNAAGPEVRLDNERRPVFLNRDLAVVVTETVMSGAGEPQRMRYVDVMAKTGGEWRFTSMIQDGWGDMLREYFPV